MLKREVTMSTRADERPPVWVGHVSMRTNVLDQSHDFMIALGLRPVGKGDGVAVLELRGGTHLVLLRTDEPLSGPAPFDLMVEDLEASHKRLAELGLSPSAIVSGRIHRSFTVRDPSGQDIEFNSSHVSGRPV
jgi:catechol 2,3-dioxygenase-like lactoylglutathione lyase family enzyme